MGSADETHHLTYRGAPAFAGMLVQMLEHEGAVVEWDPPLEQRGGVPPDLVDKIEGAVVVLAVKGSAAAVKAAVKKFREWIRRDDAVDWREEHGYL